MPKSNVRTAADARARLEVLQGLRRAHPLCAHTDAWRVVNGPGDDAPAGLTIDRYLHWMVVTARAELSPETVSCWCDGAAQLADVRGVVLKTLARPASASTSKLWSGEPPPNSLAIREDDVTLLCELDDGISTGMFLDQREVRREIRSFARDVDVLNLFAYTGAFSVHAAKAGARRVTTVDASGRALTRGRDNMIASGLDPDAHRWFRDDARTHLARAGRRGDRYGLVILDPPMFGRARSKVHALERQIDDLIESAARVVAPRGVLVVSTHAIDVTPKALADRVAAAVAGRAHNFLGYRGLPEWDHPVSSSASSEADRGDYLKTILIRLE